MTSTSELIAERDRLAARGDACNAYLKALRDLDGEAPAEQPPTKRKGRKARHAADPTIAEQRAEHYGKARQTRRAEFARVRH